MGKREIEIEINKDKWIKYGGKDIKPEKVFQLINYQVEDLIKRVSV